MDEAAYRHRYRAELAKALRRFSGQAPPDSQPPEFVPVRGKGDSPVPQTPQQPNPAP